MQLYLKYLFYQRLLTFNELNNFDCLFIFVHFDWNLIQLWQVIALSHDVMRRQQILK